LILLNINTITLELMSAPALRQTAVNCVSPLFQHRKELLENKRAAIELCVQMKFFYMFCRKQTRVKLTVIL